jgi:hypothetical protein
MQWHMGQACSGQRVSMGVTWFCNLAILGRRATEYPLIAERQGLQELR